MKKGVACGFTVANGVITAIGPLLSEKARLLVRSVLR